MQAARRQKEKEEARVEETKGIMKQNYLAERDRIRSEIMKKGEVMDFLGRLRNERIEAFQEENILRAQEASVMAPKQILQTQKLAQEVLRLKNEEIQEQKNRQVLRAQSVDLRYLEAQLRSTYAAKATKVQLLERESEHESSKCREKQQAKMIENWYNDENFEMMLESQALQKKVQYRRDIQNQLVSNYLMRQQKAEEEQRERKVIEDVSQVLHNEDVKLENKRIAKIAMARAEREAFFEAREIWKCKEKGALKDEFDRQAQIIADREAEEKRRSDKKVSKGAARDAVNEKIARKMLDNECKKREREEIITEMCAEEQNNEIASELRNNLLNKERTKKELLDDMVRQKKVVAERKANDLAVDAAFAQYLVEQFQTGVQKDREEDEIRRQKGVQYGTELKAVMMEKRALYAEGILQKQAIREQDEELEKTRMKEISEERSRILHEHAPHLEGFLKPGTMSRQDYEYMKLKACISEP